MARFLDGYKPKKKKKQETTPKKAQSPSVSKPAENRAKQAQQQKMYGGTKQQPVKRATTNNNKTTTQKRQQTTSQQTQRTVDRLQQKYGGAQPGSRNQSRTTTPSRRQRNANANMDLKQTMIQRSQQEREERRHTSNQRRLEAQRQKMGLNDMASKETQEAANRAIRNTPGLVKKAVKDTVSGHLQTIADITEMTASNENGTKAKAMKMGIDLNDKKQMAELEQERKRTVQQAKLDREKWAAEQDQRQQEWDKKVNGAGGAERAYYGAVESGTGMLTDLAIGLGTQGGSLAAMFSRTYGTTRGQAQKEGATEAEDRTYSFLQAAKEVGTELMFPGVGLAKGYAKKTGLPLAERVANNLTKRITNRTAADLTGAGVRLLGGTAEENLEEVAGFGLDPLIKEFSYGRAVRTRQKMADLQDESDQLRANIQSEDDARRVASYLSSSEWLDQNKQQYMEAGLSEKDAQEVAEKMRDYMTASLTGDTETMDVLEQDIASTLSKGEFSYTKSLDKTELLDTLASTTLLTMTTGLPGTATTAMRGSVIRDNLGTDGLRTLAESAMNYEDADASKRGEVARDRINSGKELTASQVYELAASQAQQVEKDTRRVVAKNNVVADALESDRLVAPMIMRDEKGNIHGDPIITQRYNDSAQEAESALKDLDKEQKLSLSDSELAVGSRAIAGFQTGAFTINDANALNYTNTAVREAFEKVTGVDLGQYVVKTSSGAVDYAATNAATKDALFTMAADNFIETARAETENFKDIAKGITAEQMAARVGSEGDVAISNALDTVDPADEDTYGLMASAAQNVYEYGRYTEDTWDDVSANLSEMYPGLSQEALQDVYDAAKRDKAIAETPYYNAKVTAGESTRNMDMSEAEQAEYGKFTNDTGEDIGMKERAVLESIASEFNINIRLLPSEFFKYEYVDRNGKKKTAYSNGSYDPKTGTMLLNGGNDTERNIIAVALHEITHHIAIYAPDEYLALSNRVMEAWYKNDVDAFNAAIKRKQDNYKAQVKQNLSEEQALEEVIADAMGEMSADPDFISQICTEEPSLAEQIINAIRSVMRKLRAILASGIVAEEHEDAFFKQLGIWDDAQRLWLEAAKVAQQNRASQMIDDWDANAREGSEQRYSIPEYTQEEMDAHRQVLADDMADNYGDAFTEDYQEAGYVYPNGKMLKMGVDSMRGDDHAIAGIAYDDVGYDTYFSPKAEAQKRFINEGNFRWMPENGWLNLGTQIEPTREQYNWIEDAVYDFGISRIEFTDTEGETADYKDYSEYADADEIINDIKRFYRDGKIGGSQLSQFRYSISDTNYMDAVESGDTKAAQKMVDRAAKDAGFAVKGYHGTTADFKSFKPGDIGIHFGKNKSTARTRVGRGKNTKIIPAWIALNNPIQIDVDFGSWDADYRLADYLRDEGVITPEEHQDALTVDNGSRRVKRSTTSANAALRDILKSKGYDGIEYINYYEADGATSYIVFDSEQVKSAEPVTYDDDGVIIPLSERFNNQATEYRYSLSSTAEAAGLTFTKGDGRTVFLNGDGNVIDNFTPEFFLSTPIGRTLALSSSDAFSVMSKEAVDERLKFLSDLFNLINNTQDPDLIWAVSGSLGYNPNNLVNENTPQDKINESKSKFASITGNADPQYQTTIDFTTICVKTQAVIDAMSATMKQLHRGLTEHEIIDIVYNETKMAGEQVPCPVCYVFSRWVGLGNLFTKIKEFQERYPEDMDMSDIRKSYNDLSKQVDKLAKDSGIKGGKAREILDKQIRQRIEELEELEWLYRAQNKGQSLTSEQQAELDDLRAKNEVLNHWSWLGNTRLAKDYKEIPDDVLFDINAGREFATEYPAVWRYRTTRGPSLGKAAAPYSPSRLGDTIRGIASPSSLKKIGEGSRPFLSKKGISKTARNTFKKGILNAKRQNRMNGQRLQSTSDFRFEYGLDYMLSMLELEMIGAKAQMYTKVPEAVKFLASTKAEVNCSIMPRGTGLDEDGNLVFSDVTGMAWEDALALSKAYDNVQPILVAIGPEHLRAAMKDKDITMIIPYHASGSSEARYISMMQTVEEAVMERTDFAEFENEHDVENASPEQKLCKKLRLDILTGKFDKSDLNEKEAEALTNNEILRQLYIRIYGKDETGAETKPDPKYVENFDEYGNDADCLGVYLTKAQANVMMPYEYWDKTSTIDTADAQGIAYQEYCKSLGITPVFSGWDSKGKYNAELDFTNDPGYWKVLIDRCMYNNDGTYHKQSAVSLSDVDLDMLDSKMMREEVSKPLQVNNPEKTADIANRSMARISAETGEEYTPIETSSMRHSIPDAESIQNEIISSARNLKDVPLNDALLEENRVRYSLSEKDFEKKIVAGWSERTLNLEKKTNRDPLKTSLIGLMKQVRKESETDRQYKTETLEATIKSIESMYEHARADNASAFAKEAWTAAERIVDDIDYNDDLYQQYKGIMGFFARNKIAPGDLIGTQEFDEFAKENSGKIWFTYNPSNALEGNEYTISEFYSSLCSDYPGFFPEEIKHPVDQLMKMASVLSDTDAYRDAYTSEEHAKLVEDIANNLCNIVSEGSEYRATINDFNVKAMKQRHKEALNKVREERNQITERQKQRADMWKQRYQERIQRDIEKREKTKERKVHTKLYNKILNEYNDLTRKLLNPSKDRDKNIPEQIRQPLAEMLACFDLEKARSKELEEQYMIPTRKQLNFRQLKDALEKVAKEEGVETEFDAYFNYIGEKITAVADKVDGKTIDYLDNEDLDTIEDMMKGLVAAINNWHQLEKDGESYRAQQVCEEVGQGAAEHRKLYGKAKQYSGIREMLNTITNMGELTPIYFFRQLKGLYDMYRQIRKGFDQYVRNEKATIDKIAKILAPYYKTNRKGQRIAGSELEKWRHSESAETFDLTYGPITLTIAQKMSLYCLYKRDQARMHMLSEKGGIVASETESGSKIHKAQEALKGKNVQRDQVPLTPADAESIIATLTEEQKAIADQLQDLMSNDMSDLGNKASIKLIGIALYREKNYFPIKVEGDSRSTQLEKINMREKVRNPGFSNPLKDNATNPIIIDDIFTVVASHCNEMNLYASYAVPLTNFMKVYNGSIIDEDGKTKRIKKVIRETYGDKAIQYIENFLDDINGNSFKRHGGLDDVLDKAIGQAKKAAVFANFRVALQQPTSIIRAAAVMNPKYFLGVKPSKKATAEMFEHCPIALWKSLGYYDTHFGRDIEDVMMGRNVSSKLDVIMSDAYGALDNMTWGMIWQAVKKEVKANNPKVEEGSEEFWELCNERASFVFDTTQVVDSPLHRSNDMRSKNGLVKQLTSFQAEPTLSFNVLRQGMVDTYEALKKGDKQKATEAAGRVVLVWVAQAAFVALAQTFVDALRRKGRKDGDDDEDDALAWYEEFMKYFTKNYLPNFVDDVNAINNVYYVKEIVPGILNALQGEYVYGQQNLTFQWVDTLTNGITKVRKLWAKGESDPEKWYDAVTELFGGLGYRFGLPIKTGMRGTKNFLHWFNKFTGMNVLAADGTVSRAFTDAIENIGVQGTSSYDDSGTDTSTQSRRTSFQIEGVRDGSAIDNILNKFGVNLTDAEILEREAQAARKEYQAKVDKIKGSLSEYSGEDYDKHLWDKQDLEGYGKALEEGNFDRADEIEKLFLDCGGSQDFLDGKKLYHYKKNYVKSIVYDPTDAQIEQQTRMKDFLLSHGMTEAELSEKVYKSQTAKELKVAFRLNDEDAIVEELTPLIRAGLSYDDFVKAYKYRNRIDLKKYKDSNGKYAERLKSTGIYNWPVTGTITSHFGYRSAGSTNGVGSTNHKGLDIAASMGTPVGAADGGTVVYAGWDGGFGKCVRIQHDDGTITEYAHLSWWDAKVGDTVAQGQTIGNVGSTGHSTGPHLHFGVKVNGSYVDPLTKLN